MEWFVYHENMLIAHRASNEHDFIFEMDSLVNRGDPWLLYPYLEPPSSLWIQPSFDDGSWLSTTQPLVTMNDGSIYIRKHFNPVHSYYSSVLMHVTVRSGVQVYASGQLVLEEGVSQSNNDVSFQPLIDMPLEPVTYHCSIPLDLVVNDTILAIRLLTPGSMNVSLLLELQVEGIGGMIQQTTINTPITRSEPIVPVCLISPSHV